jgi:ABC-type Fe3+ transport system permease subunit
VFHVGKLGTAYFSADTVRLFGNSVAFGVGSSTVVGGTFFAWVNERTNTPAAIDPERHLHRLAGMLAE